MTISTIILQASIVHAYLELASIVLSIESISLTVDAAAAGAIMRALHAHMRFEAMDRSPRARSINAPSRSLGISKTLVSGELTSATLRKRAKACLARVSWGHAHAMSILGITALAGGASLHRRIALNTDIHKWISFSNSMFAFF
jgi:hypothetical protein